MTTHAGRSTRDLCRESLSQKRRNIFHILQYGNVVPFNWHTKGYRCFYCSKPMNDCETLKEHTLKHSVDLNDFIQRHIITNNIPVKIDIADLACKMCPGHPLKDLEDLICHIMVAHDVDYDNTLGVCIFPFLLNKYVMNCALCENHYDNFTCMINHMYKEHVTHSFVCQICGLSFMADDRLKRHIRTRHEGYRCTVCGKMFNSSQRMEKHKQRMHGKSKTYECNVCSATFPSQYQMKVHLGKVHNVEKYRIHCEHCPKVCTTKSAMILHVQSLHSDLKYECEQCKYRTGIKFLMTLHMRKHYGDKEYKCSICEKMFTRSSNLRSHMKVHSGVSGRVCRFCRHGFTGLDDLKRHEVEVHSLE